MLDELSSAVAELMSAACEQLVLPRFRRLASDEIETKSGLNDLVTVADREAELFLTPRLLDLVDGEVIGEEACASDPGLRTRADAPVAWTVDPVDGTGNFDNSLTVVNTGVMFPRRPWGAGEARVSVRHTFSIPKRRLLLDTPLTLFDTMDKSEIRTHDIHSKVLCTMKMNRSQFPTDSLQPVYFFLRIARAR